MHRFEVVLMGGGMDVPSGHVFAGPTGGYGGKVRIREASRVFGLHQDTVCKMLAYSVPPVIVGRLLPRGPSWSPSPDSER